MDELHALTTALVTTPSHEDPTAAGDLIESWLREETNASVRRDDVGNVLARRSGGEGSETTEQAHTDGALTDGASLALVGHHDVVPPDDEQVGPDGDYVAERRDGRLYGRGAADMKGAVAAMLLAFRDATVPEGDDGPADAVVFASFVGEEVGGEGARHAIENGFAPDVAVVGEGSTDYSADGVTDVAVAHKGRRASTVVANGTSAHASVPEEGDNAIYRGTAVVESLQSLAVPTVEVAGTSVSGSLVVTEIDGGTAWNVVPDRCEITIDERTVPGDRAPIDRVAGEGIEWTVEQDLPPMRCGDEAFAADVLAAARSTFDRSGDADPQHVVKPHATDAGWLADAGTDCVICGPAEPGEAHTATESVSLAVLEQCHSIYRDVIESHVTG